MPPGVFARTAALQKSWAGIVSFNSFKSMFRLHICVKTFLSGKIIKGGLRICLVTDVVVAVASGLSYCLFFAAAAVIKAMTAVTVNATAAASAVAVASG